MDAWQAAGWLRLSCADGSKGPRLYDWALTGTASPGHWLLARRSLHPGEKGELELAFFRCWSPRPVTLPELVRWQERGGASRTASAKPGTRPAWTTTRSASRAQRRISPMEPDLVRERQPDVRSLLAVLVLLAGCSSGGYIASPANPRAALTPARRHSSAPVTARVVLPSRTLAAGSSMSGQVLVENTTGHAIHVSGCVKLFQVLLTSSAYRPVVGWLTCLQRFTIPVGESRYPVRVWASYSQCSQGRPQHGLKPCRPGGRMPPLPPGTYHAKLFQDGNLVRVPPAFTVRVTPSMLT